MRRYAVLCAIGVLAIALPALAGAVTLTYVGNALDLGASWRTASVAKPLDPDGDNVFGTDAFAVWTGTESWNNYVAFVSKAATVSYPTYYQIDNPVGAGTVNSGTLTVHPGYATEATLFTFRVNVVGPAPATFRVGVMTDNLDNPGYGPITLTLAYGSSTNVTTLIDATQGDNQIPDWYFFDISGATNGDTFTVKGTGGPYGFVTCGAVSFDTVLQTSATTVTYAGSDLDRGARWRTTSVAKPLDGDSNNVYGTDAYAVWEHVECWSNYVSLVSESSSFYAGNSGYAYIDNPTGAGTNMSGMLDPSPGAGFAAPLFRFQVNGTVPGTFRLGVMTDNADSGLYVPATLTLRLDGSFSHATISPDPTLGSDQIPDWYFFEVHGATNGETFTLSGTGGAVGMLDCGAVSFDTVLQPSPVTTITAVGSDLDQGARWRTASVAKPLDADRNNVYGTDAYAAWGHVECWSNYVSLVSEASIYPGNVNYAYIDNPAGPGTIMSGTLNPSPGIGAIATLFRFQVNGTVPRTFRLGVMTDNGDGGNLVPATLTLAADGFSTRATLSPDPTLGFDRVPDWYFFDVRGATNGATFTLSGTGGASSYVACGAVSFDTVPPRGTMIRLL